MRLIDENNMTCTTGEIMKFVVADSWRVEPDTVFLLNDSWDDWFVYETQYYMLYVDEDCRQHRIGYLKIAKKNQTERRATLPSEFNRLGSTYFSLGASEDYYLNLKNSIPDKRNIILIALNDVAYNLDLYDEFKFQHVLMNSLMRDISISTLRGQFHRMAHGGARLTDYNFVYTTPSCYSGESIDLAFDVMADSKPPTNIHAIIGKNGVGKTTLLRNMIRSVASQLYSKNIGGFDDRMRFSNVVFVSYSAFDMPLLEGDLSCDNEDFRYSYVGLIGKRDGKKYIKNIFELASDFSDSLYNVAKGRKNELWRNIITILDSDKTFKHYQICEWADNALTSIQEVRKNKDLDAERKAFVENISGRFNELSSGHKVILLTLVKLIELVEEKTLVIMDEPEEHLHPPLVSAFIRALSYLLIHRNGVGIIATHSPVIVQEIPRKCVWKVRRENEVFVSERPKIETFGENLGEITSEIFGYEVLESGFHKMLSEVAIKRGSYNAAVTDFGNELGKEARSILKAYIYERNNDED